MGARTDAARAEVVARRQLLLVEVTGLEAAGRSAIDIPAKMRRAPAKTAALVAATAFLVLGGPAKGYRAVRRAIFGPKADLPKSMLPKEIDKSLRALGDDGDQVRGVVEREFASYLEKTRPEREARHLKGAIVLLGASLLRPAASQTGKRLAKELFSPESRGFAQAAERIKARREARKAGSGVEVVAVAPTGDAGTEPKHRRGRNILRPR